MKIFLSLINFWIILTLLMPAQVFAQGFQKLQDKYGAPSSIPLQQKEPDATSQDSDDEGVPEGMIMLNGVDVDIKDMIKLMANTTGKNFILNDRVRGKITIISEKPMTYDMAYQAFLSALEVNGFTTVETPAGLINVIPQKDALQSPIELFKEASPVTDKYITRIMQLSNISANDLVNVVKPMVSKNGSIIAYPTTNSVIITDTGSNINHILKLVKELDQEGPQEVLEIIPIVNADAKDIADKVTEIFEDEKEDTRNVRRRRISRRGAQQEMEDVQAISKVIADERTNSVIIMGTKRSIVKVKALIARLDRSIEGIEGRIHVYYLRHANAKEMSEVLSGLVEGAEADTKSKSKSRTAKSDGAGLELEGGVKVTADESTNSLIITASPKDFTTLVDKVIQKLDIVRPQVYLEAVIMSLDVNKTSTWGIAGNGGFNNTTASGNTFSAFGAVLPLTSNAVSSIASASGGLGAGAFSSDAIDFTLSDGSTISIPAISGILQALQSDTDVNVLSTPSILTLDNEEATIQVGQDVPVPSGTTVSSGVTTFNVSREEVGIILKITPQISESDTVRLQLEQEISSVFSTDANLGPTIDTKKVQTVVIAKNKQTIVIGGLIDDSQSVTTHKVPLLGDIPVLGNLFKSRTTTKEKTNLIVFITPYIIRNRGDYMAILKKKIEERNAFIDMNYGTSQKKSIRQAISNHAEDLLEFKCKDADLTDPCYRGWTTSYTTPAYQDVQKVKAEHDSSAQEFQDPRKRRRYKVR